MALRGRPPKHGFSVPALSDIPLMLELWNRALASPYGIRIKPTGSLNPHNLMGKLYAARRECGHKAYVDLKLVETETEVWIQPREP
jgi:hypothetical protein